MYDCAVHTYFRYGRCDFKRNQNYNSNVYKIEEIQFILNHKYNPPYQSNNFNKFISPIVFLVIQLRKKPITRHCSQAKFLPSPRQPHIRK